MLNKETIEKLKGLGLDPDKLISAIKDDKEVAFDVPDGELFTADQLTARDTEKLKEGKKEGEKDAINIAKKELKKAGIELQKERWGDIADEIKTQINSTGDEKTRTLQEQVQALLKDKETLSAKEQEYQKQIKTVQFDSQLLSMLPKEVAGFKNTSLLRELKAEMTFEEKDGVTIPMRNGKPLTDPKTHAPLSIEQAVEAYKVERKWVEVQTIPTGGRGGQTRTIASTGGIKTASEARSAWIDANPDKDPNGPEYVAYYQKLVKDTPDFDMYS